MRAMLSTRDYSDPRWDILDGGMDIPTVAISEAARILAETEAETDTFDGHYTLSGRAHDRNHPGRFLASSLSALDSLPASEWASALVVG